MVLLVLAVAGALLQPAVPITAPSIYWTSTPTLINETLLISGAGLDGAQISLCSGDGVSGHPGRLLTVFGRGRRLGLRRGPRLGNNRRGRRLCGRLLAHRIGKVPPLIDVLLLRVTRHRVSRLGAYLRHSLLALFLRRLPLRLNNLQEITREACNGQYEMVEWKSRRRGIKQSRRELASWE